MALCNTLPPSWMLQSEISLSPDCSEAFARMAVSPRRTPPAPRSPNSQRAIRFDRQPRANSSPYVPRLANVQASNTQFRTPSPQTALGTPTAACENPPTSLVRAGQPGGALVSPDRAR